MGGPYVCHKDNSPTHLHSIKSADWLDFVAVKKKAVIQSWEFF